MKNKALRFTSKETEKGYETLDKLVIDVISHRGADWNDLSEDFVIEYFNTELIPMFTLDKKMIVSIIQDSLSECLFFKRNKRNKPVYTLLDCGEVVLLRPSDLNKEGLCIIDDIDNLTQLINNRNVEKIQVNPRIVKENIKNRDWFLSPQAAFDHDNTIKLDLNILNVLL